MAFRLADGCATLRGVDVYTRRRTWAVSQAVSSTLETLPAARSSISRSCSSTEASIDQPFDKRRIQVDGIERRLGLSNGRFEVRRGHGGHPRLRSMPRLRDEER